MRGNIRLWVSSFEMEMETINNSGILKQPCKIFTLLSKKENTTLANVFSFSLGGGNSE